MVTGQYAWVLGNHHMRSQLTQAPRVLTEELREAGYHVNWANKTDFNFEPSAGFADARHPWADWLAKRDPAEEKPFFLYHNFAVTHESTMWQPTSEHWCAAQERIREDWRLRPGDRPSAEAVRVPAYLVDHPEVRHDIVRFYEALAILDQQAGELLQALERSGQANNTYVLYLTDHGRGLWREKRWPYAAGVHLSLIIRGPGIAPGTVCQDLVSWVDIAPTILALAGVPASPEHHGQVFLGPDRDPPRTEVLAGRDRMGESFDRVRMVREKRFHYCRNFFPELPYAQRCWYQTYLSTTEVMREWNAMGRLAPEQAHFFSRHRPPEELYDAEEDPDMVHNLATHPAHQDTLRRLRAKLDEHLARWQDLAELPERQLIAEGRLRDQLDSYYARLKPLSERHRIEDFRHTVVEMPLPVSP